MSERKQLGKISLPIRFFAMSVYTVTLTLSKHLARNLVKTKQNKMNT